MFNNSSRSSNHSNIRASQKFSPSRRVAPDVPKLKVPEWVYCQKCFVNHDSDSNIVLLNCGHMFCKKCLSIVPGQNVHCIRCKDPMVYRDINESMDSKYHKMFMESFADPVLQIDIKVVQFMLTKHQEYVKYLSECKRRGPTVSENIKKIYFAAKIMTERNAKLAKYNDEITRKLQVIKAATAKKYKNVQMLRELYSRKLAQSQSGNQSLKKVKEQDLNFISSGRNVRSNQYIGQVNSSQWSMNQNQKLKDSSSLSFGCSEQSQRSSVKSNVYHRNSPQSNHTNDIRGPPPTFRPNTRPELKSNNARFEPPYREQKRLVPSFQRDEYTIPSKRPSINYPLVKDSFLNFTSSRGNVHHKIGKGTSLNSTSSSTGKSSLINSQLVDHQRSQLQIADRFGLMKFINKF